MPVRPDSYYQPPRYQPNAVATDKGWVHPNTQELLVARKGLLNGRAVTQVIVDEAITIPEGESLTIPNDVVLEFTQPETVTDEATDVNPVIVPAEPVVAPKQSTPKRTAKKA